MSERILNLAETKGSFQLRGKVTGVKKENFYRESEVGKREKRVVSFGVKTSENNINFVTLTGFTKDKVFFYKKAEKDTKGETKEVPWDKRNQKIQEGFNLIGVDIGLSLKTNENGSQVTDRNMFVEYDACKFLFENLKDDMNVLVRGSIKYQDYMDATGNIKRRRDLVPSKIYLAKDIDFDSETFKEEANFEQEMVVTELKKEQDGNNINVRVISTIIDYNTICETDFVIKNSEFAKNVFKHLKPYTKIKFHGNIESNAITEDVGEVDDWGGDNNLMNKKLIDFKRDFVITGRDATSIDSTTYTKEAIEKNKQALVEYQNKDSTDKGDWGGTSTSSSEDDGWGAF